MLIWRPTVKSELVLSFDFQKYRSGLPHRANALLFIGDFLSRQPLPEQNAGNVLDLCRWHTEIGQLLLGFLIGKDKGPHVQGFFVILRQNGFEVDMWDRDADTIFILRANGFDRLAKIKNRTRNYISFQNLWIGIEYAHGAFKLLPDTTVKFWFLWRHVGE